MFQNTKKTGKKTENDKKNKIKRKLKRKLKCLWIKLNSWEYLWKNTNFVLPLGVIKSRHTTTTTKKKETLKLFYAWDTIWWDEACFYERWIVFVALLKWKTRIYLESNLIIALRNDVQWNEIGKETQHHLLKQGIKRKSLWVCALIVCR